MGRRTHMENPRDPQRRREIFRQLLGLFPTGSIVDLGTGHGGFAVTAADLGWTVTGVDARTVRWPDDDRVTWVQQDVREHDLTPYDVVLCLGLFYHLTLDDQLSLLRRANSKPLIIDTHVANDTVERRLSEQVTMPGGYVGRMYTEGRMPTASVKNRESFRPTLESFYRMLTDTGFSTILTAEPWVIPDRTFFLALPASRVATAQLPRQRRRERRPFGQRQGSAGRG